MREIVNRIDDGACLGVAIVKGLEIFVGPVCPVHVVKWLCMPQLGLDLLMEEGDAITMDKALGNHLAHRLGLALGLDDKALFGSKERVSFVVLVGPWSVVGEAGGA